MKRVSFSVLLAAVLCLIGINAWAYDIAVENADGVTIYYNYSFDKTELWVTSGGYSGVLVIPEEVTFMNRTRKVTSIGVHAFNSCNGLTSVTIPNSVTSIGAEAFRNCSGLTSITIPSSVTNMGQYAFEGCSGLTSVYISDIESWCKIVFDWGSNPLLIASHLFLNEEEVKNLVIPGSVTSIGEYAFSNCSSLTSVTIPNSVTSIGYSAFSGCSGLTSVTIPNSVTNIEDGAFGNCSSVSSVMIGNGVTSIGYQAFFGCTSLTSITIGNSVTSIGYQAFFDCDIPEVFSKIENPFAIDTRTFTDNTFYNATLYVPAGTIDKYKATEGWQKFAFIEEENGGDTPEPQKCAIPTISFVNGEVVFACETEGVTFVPTVTCAPQQQLNGNKLKLGSTFTVSVFATKEGYEDSDVATTTIDVSSVADVNGDGEVNVSDVTALVSIILGQ